MTKHEVLELLASALASIDGDSVRRNRVRRLRESPGGLVLDELSAMERATSSVNSVRLIAMAKQVLTGKATGESFFAACRAVIGV